MSTNHEAIKEAEHYLQRGEKLEAIKLLKEKYNFSLEESKILIDALEGKMTPGAARHGLPETGELDSDARAHLTELLVKRKKVAAISYVKNRMGLKLRQAKTFVEKLEKELDLPAPKPLEFLKGPVGVMMLIFGGLGMVFLGIAVGFFLDQTSSISKSERATGEVIRLRQQPRGNGTSPVIEYEFDGQTWLHSSEVYSSPPAYTVGEQVALYVNREDPTDVVIDTFIDRYFGILIFGVLGGVFVLIPVIVYLVSRRS